MKIKKLLALLMTAAMLIGLIPAAAISEPADAPEVPTESASVIIPADKGGDKAHESYFDATYTYLSFTDSGTHDWVNKYDSTNDYYYLESGNAGVASSTSIISTDSIYMVSGEKVTFQYWYSTETTYDHFDFIVNDENKISESGESNGWKTYTWTAPSAGFYTLKWRYYKDGSQNVGSDCVRLAYCVYSRHLMNWVDQAALAAGGGGMSGSAYTYAYGFYPASSDSSSHPFYIRSNNIGQASSTATYAVYCTVPEGAGQFRLRFDYAISSEHPHDHFVLRENNVVIFDSANLSSAPAYEWKGYTYNIPGPGNYMYSFEYVKDNSVDEGSDVLCLDNIRLEGFDTADARYLGLSGLNSDNTNATLYFNTPAGYQGFSAGSSDRKAKPNNRYVDSSTACMETYVTMAAGETLSFKYSVSSEKNYDFFRFYANGDQQLEASGWTDHSIKTFTFTATQTKTYIFRWEYVKDSSNSRGRDEVCVYDVKYTGSYHNTCINNLDEILNDPDTELQLQFIGGVGVGGWFEPYVTTGWSAAVSRNKYYENSRSAIGSRDVYLNATDRISFEYKVSCEENNFDSFGFIVYRDGAEVFHFSDCGDNTWKTRTYVCEQGGLYSFAWVYAKDEEGDYYNDYAMIDNVKIDRNETTLYYACNPDSDNPEDLVFSFMTGGDYPFVTEGDDDGRYYARSTNMGVNSSESWLEATTYLFPPGGKISFDFNISSEANYDVLRFYVNDTLVWSASGNTNPGWHTVTIPNTYQGMVTLKWIYHKDTSTHVGDDRACIDNVWYIPDPVGLLGDVNGDGNVNANDALLLMRYALGLVPASALDLTVADVNHDGNVNANDALMIMRYALGLMPLN